MTGSLATASTWSYGVGAAVFLAFAIRLTLGWRGGLHATLLLVAVIATALWAFASFMLVFWSGPTMWLATYTADALRYVLWFVFLASLLNPKRPDDAPQRAFANRLPWWLVGAVGATPLIALVLSEDPSLSPLFGSHVGTVAFGMSLGTAIFGLILVEQLVRRAPKQARWGIKPLCLGLSGMFAFDLFLYADAMLFGRLDLNIWAARGIAHALIVPLIAVATARSTMWTIEMHLSRRVIFHSTALLVSGVFLLAVAAAGYYIRYFGGDWGEALQIEVSFAALLFVALAVLSGRFQSKLRVFISKNFFSYRYDYREEWLRFTHALSSDGSPQRVQERIIKAIADLVESPAGALWLRQEGGNFQPACRYNMETVGEEEPTDGSLAQFLERTGWVIDVSEYASSSSRYAGLILPRWLAATLPAAWLVVPLISGSELIGFVVLAMPRAAIDVNWEVRDLLKTASRQAASYLGHMQVIDALLEARKFEAFNRMSAFVVHDLKNLVTQLSLMLKNAQRHRHNPEFQDDMLMTVDRVVGRMNNLMLQLRTGTTPTEGTSVVDLESIARRVCAAKSNMGVPIELDLTPGIHAMGHYDRLEHVIGHLVQNAIDAVESGGKVAVQLHRDGRTAVIEVADSGAGMTEEFIRERLFKAFETTKASGMGIGVYESSRYIAGIGGRIAIDSKPNEGTRVRVLLPLAEITIASPSESREVA